MGVGINDRGLQFGRGVWFRGFVVGFGCSQLSGIYGDSKVGCGLRYSWWVLGVLGD